MLWIQPSIDEQWHNVADLGSEVFFFCKLKLIRKSEEKKMGLNCTLKYFSFKIQKLKTRSRF
jgi:hypothetical protein